MTDSILLFPHGFRLLDSDGVPLGGARVRFFEVGLNTPKEVFSDADLETSLGPIVYTRSDGYLVVAQDSNTTVAVYMSSGRYGVDILDEDSVTVYPAKDDQQGAVDTSSFLTSQTANALIIPVVSIAINSTIGASHNGKLINAAGNITLTFTSPVTLGDSWNVRVRCDDATNSIKLVASAGTFKGPGFNLAGIALYGLGNAYDIVCDGGAFSVTAVAPGRVQQSGRVFSCVSRASSAPATTAGLFYLVSGAFSTFSIGDIIEGTGQATFIGYTPPTNSGWIAYVQAEGIMYRHTAAGWVTFADQPELAADPANPAVDTMRWYPKDVDGVTHLFTQDESGTLKDLTVIPASVSDSYATSVTLSTVIPYDDTIPQNTEGTQILTKAITLALATSKIRIRFQGFGSIASGSRIIAALFQDSIASALAASAVRPAGVDQEYPIIIEYEFTPGSVGPFTFKINVGADSGNMRMNGTSSARKFGGVAISTLVAQEVFV